ncbi:LuxR C-terminal-related transcriptional regulator [Slackia isoflavoniconvertens]|uniref:LuxR C-terminal-related transcriptional regulator n=1 Tax=Slackia isoflavoniconvertens TaxID=572010 RepID=UPI003AB984EC
MAVELGFTVFAVYGSVFRSRPYICEALYLSDGTVKTHISHIYRKFDVHGRQELLDAVQSELAHFEPTAFVDIEN